MELEQFLIYHFWINLYFYSSLQNKGSVYITVFVPINISYSAVHSLEED